MNTTKRSTVRYALYTRKSSEEGLEQEFNSLDAQRDAGEAYVASQRHAGWTLIAEHYDDGGFTGSNMRRPALQHLLADIAAGKIDCVLVHKVDRLSRSLLDFARMMEIFEQHQVAFVSITQQFNSATSMGRLVLNVLLSFAQFEREIISERTRDKIAAARRKGIWSGGMPLLGYDVGDYHKLLINQAEAEQVCTIFSFYLQHGSLRRVLEEIDRHGWLTKCWQTRKGNQRGGRPFTKSTLHQLLTNITYLGKVRHKHEAYVGEHQPVIDNDTWDQVQHLLNQNGRGEPHVHHRSDALLKGLLFCGLCHHAMTPAHSSVRHKKYHYYICTTRQKLGAHRCPSTPLRAETVENAVLEQLQSLARHPAQWHDYLQQAQRLGSDRLTELAAEKSTLDKELAGWMKEIRGLARHLAKQLDALPRSVRETTRIPVGIYRGLRFGMVLHPQFPPDVYLEGAITRQSTLPREHQGPRAVLNAIERLSNGYGAECVRVQQDLAIAESQLRDYGERLGKPFLHDAYLSELTSLRDQLKTGLSAAAHESGSEAGPDVSELAGRIKALKAANTIEATPQRVSQQQSTAEEPVTARIRRRLEVIATAESHFVADVALGSSATLLSALSPHSPIRSQPSFQDRVTIERQCKDQEPRLS